MSITKNIQDFLDDYDVGMKEKFRWHSYWQDLAEVLLPKRADITTGSFAGEDRQKIIYDGAPIRNCRSLSNALDSLIKPKNSPWFGMSIDIEEIAEMEEVRQWFDIVERTMWNAIYAKNARFIQRTGETDRDLVALGTGCIYTGENRQLNGLLFKPEHPKDIVIYENEDGVVDKIYIRRMITARQALKAYGEDNLGARTKELLRSTSTSGNKVEFIIGVYPREERNLNSLLSTDLPFGHVVIDKESEHLVKESGYHEFPYAIPRWETASGEVYGRSPGMVALPDALTLQAMGKTMLIAGQKAVDPPLGVIDDSVIGVPRTFPGGITAIDGEAARSFGGNPVFPIEMGKQIPLGIEMQNEKRQAVEVAFFKNVFNLPIDGPQMTATEIIERKEEFIREIGPVFGQLESDYIGHIVERVFGVMFRAGAFPPPPEILRKKNVQFKFQSPIQRARKQIEAAATGQSLEILRPFVEADPSIMDNFDGDQIARDLPEVTGMPQRWLRPIEERDGIRKQRQEAQANRDAMAQTQVASEVIQNAG